MNATIIKDNFVPAKQLCAAPYTADCVAAVSSRIRTGTCRLSLCLRVALTRVDLGQSSLARMRREDSGKGGRVERRRDSVSNEAAACAIARADQVLRGGPGAHPGRSGGPASQVTASGGGQRCRKVGTHQDALGSVARFRRDPAGRVTRHLHSRRMQSTGNHHDLPDLALCTTWTSCRHVSWSRASARALDEPTMEIAARKTLAISRSPPFVRSANPWRRCRAASANRCRRQSVMSKARSRHHGRADRGARCRPDGDGP